MRDAGPGSGVVSRQVRLLASARVKYRSADIAVWIAAVAMDGSKSYCDKGSEGWRRRNALRRIYMGTVRKTEDIATPVQRLA